MERIERNIESALAALRTDNSEWIKAELSARMLAESILKEWYKCQEDPSLRSKFRNRVEVLVDQAAGESK